MGSFFKSKKAGYYLMIPALVLAVLAFIFYRSSLDTKFGSLSVSAEITFVIGIVLCALSLVLDYREIKFAAAAVLLYACLDSISSQANYITNVLVSIDGNSFSTGFICASVFSLAAWILALIASKRTEPRLVEKIAGCSGKEAGNAESK